MTSSSLPSGRKAPSGTLGKTFSSGAYAKLPPVRPGQALRLAPEAYGIRLGPATTPERFAPQRAAQLAEAARAAAAAAAEPKAEPLGPGGNGRLFSLPAAGGVRSLQLGRRPEGGEAPGAARKAPAPAASAAPAAKLPFGGQAQAPASGLMKFPASGEAKRGSGKPAAGSGAASAGRDERTQAFGLEELRPLGGPDSPRKPNPSKAIKGFASRPAEEPAPKAPARPQQQQAPKPPASGQASRSPAPPGPAGPRKDGRP